MILEALYLTAVVLFVFSVLSLVGIILLVCVLAILCGVSTLLRAGFVWLKDAFLELGVRWRL